MCQLIQLRFGEDVVVKQGRRECRVRMAGLDGEERVELGLEVREVASELDHGRLGFGSGLGVAVLRGLLFGEGRRLGEGGCCGRWWD